MIQFLPWNVKTKIAQVKTETATERDAVDYSDAGISLPKSRLSDGSKARVLHQSEAGPSSFSNRAGASLFTGSKEKSNISLEYLKVNKFF